MTKKGIVLEYPARIKVHHPCIAGVLIELAGEFDLSCLTALEHAFARTPGLESPVYVDLAGVTFMDALCLRELARSPGARRVLLCRPSREVTLGLSACGLEESVAVVPNDDPGYVAVISEACKCRRAKSTLKQGEHHLFVHTYSGTQARRAGGA